MFGRRIEIEEPSQPAVATLGHTLLRVALGVILAAHGLQKIMGYPAWRAQVGELGLPYPEVAALFALAGELLGGLGLLLGLVTRVAAFGAFCVMAVAIATVHLNNGLFVQDGGFEFPLIVAAAAFLFLTTGPGPISLDAYLRRRARVRAIQHDETWLRPPYQPVSHEALYEHPAAAGERRRQDADRHGRESRDR